MASVSRFFLLLTFFKVIRLVHGTVDLDRSDHDTLLTLRGQLTSDGQLHPAQETKNPCGSGNEVHCEFTLSNSNTYVLRVTSIIIQSQELGGFLSPVIGQLSELKQLSLPNNSLVNRIPSDIADCQKLEMLDLRNNQFSGPVPSQLSLLTFLRELDLSSNMLSGNLDFLANLPNLQKLSLSNNLFTGKLPASLQSFSNIGSPDISVKELSESPDPVNKNVEIPRYVFAERSMGNQKSAVVTTRPRKVKMSKKKKIIERIYGFLAGGIAGIAVGLVFRAIRVRKRSVLPSAIQLTQIPGDRVQDFTFLTKRDALETLEVIGRGRNVVYRYEQYAVKRIQIADENDGLKLIEDFRMLEMTRHPNLLPPIALVSHAPTKSDYLVISSFMKNGSLQDMLIQAREGTRQLDWEVRYRIAMGVAEGLEYLHTNYSPCIIHRDIKPANILLDNNMEARIADFEDALVVPKNKACVSVDNIRGTFGFMAPECYMSPTLTDKYDVFSFGVLLGVLVTGKFPSDELFQGYGTGERSSLVGWASYVMNNEDPLMAIDPHLRNNGFEEQMFFVLKIACLCTQENPRSRPNSTEVKRMLSRVRRAIVL